MGLFLSLIKVGLELPREGRGLVEMSTAEKSADLKGPESDELTTTTGR